MSIRLQINLINIVSAEYQQTQMVKYLNLIFKLLDYITAANDVCASQIDILLQAKRIERF